MLSAVRHLEVADGILTVTLAGADDITVEYADEPQAHHFAEAVAAALDPDPTPDDRPPVTVETLPPRRIPWARRS